MQIRVYYEDTDCGGIVYHANYLKFCERARSERFFAQGQLPVWGDYAFVVHTIHATYFAPAKLGDLLTISTKTKEMRKASLSLLQAVWREQTLLFQMEVGLACVKNNRSAKIPDELKQYLEWNEWKH